VNVMSEKNKVIVLTKAEIQSGLNRQRAAELLILQLPEDHDGRNTWLLNYGIGNQSQVLRSKHMNKPTWNYKTESATTVNNND